MVFSLIAWFGSLVMIRNFSDHAANERTFLAWVRTAIALMAFGFVVEKFDLFLRVAGLGGRWRAQPLVGAAFGLSIIAAGVVMAIIATLRFVRTGRDIDAEAYEKEGARLDLALGGLLSLLGAALVLYLAYSLISG